MHKTFLKNLDKLACPGCRAALKLDGENLKCTGCGAAFEVENGIPLLFWPHDRQERGEDVTQIVKKFYETNPFPNYDDLDSRESLAEKASAGMFANLLDQQLPGGATVLEAGCGTGQLSNFLGIQWNRSVFGSDMCLNSLRLAEDFRSRSDIKNAGFLQMNLFRPAFREEAFEVVICNGVLHHTGDPLGGFKSLSRLVKPSGYIVIGLYNTIGRLFTDMRRFLFKISADKLRFLDDHVRNKNYNEARKRAWFMDQYKHPHESKHSYSEVIQWFETNGFEFLFSVPKIDPGPFDKDEHLFEPHDKGSRFTRFMTEVDMLMRGGVDGGLFIMIGQKKGVPKPAQVATQDYEPQHARA